MHRGRARRAGLDPARLNPAAIAWLSGDATKLEAALEGQRRELAPPASQNLAPATPDVPTYSNVVRASRVWSLRAVQTLAAIMEDAEVRPEARIKAAEALLDRALGKAPQHLDISTDLPAKQLTDDALRMAAAEILSRLPAGAVLELEPAKPEAEPIEAEIVEDSSRPITQR